MNKSKKHHSMIERAKKSFVGRIVCRLAGEEKGAVMMEYVIVAVMIAAAVAIGAWLFGAQILGMFGVAGDEMIGNHDEAVANQTTIRGNKPAQDAAAITAGKTFQHAEGEGGAEGTVTPGNAAN